MSELRLIAILELLLATLLWGFGFIATIWALKEIAAYDLIFLRFLIASLVGLPFVLKQIKGEKAAEYLRLSFFPALLLTGTLIFQTVGLRYTTATKSAFLTTLYVVIVPLMESVLSRKPPTLGLWTCVLTALLGTAMIVNFDIGAINQGDVLTLICAVIAAVQIYWIGRVSPGLSHPFAFNIYQCLWSVIVTAPLIVGPGFMDKIRAIPSWSPEVIWGVISLALGSTVIAFFLQVRAQKRLSATVSSLLFLLESPFALFFAVLLLGESLNRLEAGGAVLIFVAAFAASLLEKKK